MGMRSWVIPVTVIAALGWVAGAVASGDLTRQAPVELRVQLGDEKGERRFFPDLIELEVGKLYRLILSNPSPEEHYFSSDGLAQAVFTRKVQVNDADGTGLAEVKGSIREIEVSPGATAEWWFVPIRAGRFKDLKCTIPEHFESGMRGEIVIR